MDTAFAWVHETHGASRLREPQPSGSTIESTTLHRTARPDSSGPLRGHRRAITRPARVAPPGRGRSAGGAPGAGAARSLVFPNTERPGRTEGFLRSRRGIEGRHGARAGRVPGSGRLCLGGSDRWRRSRLHARWQQQRSRSGPAGRHAPRRRAFLQLARLEGRLVDIGTLGCQSRVCRSGPADRAACPLEQPGGRRQIKGGLWRISTL